VCCSIVTYHHYEAAVLVSPTLNAQTRAFLGPRRLEKPPSSWSQKPSPARRSSPCIAVLVVFRCVSCFTVAYHHYETALLVAPTPSARRRRGQIPLQATANEVEIMRCVGASWFWEGQVPRVALWWNPGLNKQHGCSLAQLWLKLWDNSA